MLREFIQTSAWSLDHEPAQPAQHAGEKTWQRLAQLKVQAHEVEEDPFAELAWTYFKETHAQPCEDFEAEWNSTCKAGLINR